MRNAKLHTQKGWTLMEMGVVLVIVALLSAAYFAFIGGSANGSNLAGFLERAAIGAKKYATDTGSYPISGNMAAFSMLGANANSAGGRANGVAATAATWKGPYIPDMGGVIDAVASTMDMSKFAEGATLTFQSAPGGLGRVYWFQVNNVDYEIIKAAYYTCMGENAPAPTAVSPNAGVATDIKKCYATPAAFVAGAQGNGSFSYTIDNRR
jgi:type II secretory pathway pseudopilin PulG